MSRLIRPPYSVISADCPWSYQNWTDKANGAAVSHYDTMSVEAIADIPVGDWAGDDCILFLWGTWTLMDDAFMVMQSWGFNHVTGIPWIKTFPDKAHIRRGIGFWTASASEFLLIGRKGNPKRTKVDVIGALVGEDRQFWAPIGKHSAKPIRVTRWMEELFPDAKRLELFGRRERPGWTVLGRSLGHELGPWGVRPYHPPPPTTGLFQDSTQGPRIVVPTAFRNRRAQ